MAPIINISDEHYERASKILELAGVDYSIPESERTEVSENDFIYVPSINLDVARQRTHQGKNWYDTHKALNQEGSRMLTIPEFVEFLKHTRDHERDVYRDVTAVRNPWRAEWIDAYFEKRQDGLYVLTENKSNSEKLDEDTLMQDKTSGISLDSWLSNPTNQGLPKADVEKGNLYSWHPRDKGVAWFNASSDGAGLGCDWGPSVGGLYIGVRAAKPRE